MKNNRRVITIALAAAIFLIIAAILLYKSPSCLMMYNGIENELDKANYCKLDSDCGYIMLGGKYVEFGCAHYINKEADKQYFYDKMRKYADKCTKMINDCGLVAAPSCVGGKCIYLEKAEAVSYIACGCGCCSTENPRVECLNRSKGDDMNLVIKKDKEMAGSPECANMGCSAPIKYVYCD